MSEIATLSKIQLQQKMIWNLFSFALCFLGPKCGALLIAILSDLNILSIQFIIPYNS